MSRLQTLIDEAKQHTVTFKKPTGETYFALSLLWVILIGLGAPQAVLLAAVLYLMDVIEIAYDGRALEARFKGGEASGDKPKAG